MDPLGYFCRLRRLSGAPRAEREIAPVRGDWVARGWTLGEPPGHREGAHAPGGWIAGSAIWDALGASLVAAFRSGRDGRAGGMVVGAGRGRLDRACSNRTDRRPGVPRPARGPSDRTVEPAGRRGGNALLRDPRGG